MPRNDLIRTYHEDRNVFRQALTFTEADTGFNARLIEKDDYGSIVLHDLALFFRQELVFKGGTCLSKVHANFYRLSEDLDFVMPADIGARRAERRMKVAPLRDHLAMLPERFPCFRAVEPLQGSNRSMQYSSYCVYRSAVTGEDEGIKVEISLREPLCQPVEHRAAQTMLIDPFRSAPVLRPIFVSVLSLHETYAEKFRAALTRRDPAIRDFYDVDHAVRMNILEPTDSSLLELVRQKLTIPGNDLIDVSRQKLQTLDRQREPQLRPVLRDSDYARFDLGRAFAIVELLAEAIQG